MTTRAATSADSPVGPQAGRLSTGERSALAAASVVFLIVALALLWHPPVHHTVVTVTGSKSSVTDTKAATDLATAATALFGFSAVLALVAGLGLRFSNLEFGGAKLSSEVQEATESEAKSVPDKPDQKSLVEDPTAAEQHSEAVWQSLNTWAREALIDWAASEQTRITGPVSTHVINASKPAGKGNHAWLVRLRGDDGDSFVLKVSTGKGSAQASEHDQ